jgi:hypothetical protein
MEQIITGLAAVEALHTATLHHLMVVMAATVEAVEHLLVLVETLVLVELVVLD